MKKIIKILTLALLLSSCSDYEVIDTKVIKGVISAKDEGNNRFGRFAKLPRLYVQSTKETTTVDVPFEDENLFKVGDTICVITKTIKKIK